MLEKSAITEAMRGKALEFLLQSMWLDSAQSFGISKNYGDAMFVFEYNFKNYGNLCLFTHSSSTMTDRCNMIRESMSIQGLVLYESGLYCSLTK